MADFFHEFETYMGRAHGETDFFRKILEETLKPLHDSLQGITKDEILAKIGSTEEGTTTGDTLGSPSKKESGLSQKDVPVFINGIDDSVIELLGKKGSGGGGFGGAGLGLAGLAGGALGGGILGMLLGSGANIGEMAGGVKDGVETLLSIGQDSGKDSWDMLKDGGKLALMLGGLGIGIAAFSYGKGVATLVNWGEKKIGGMPFAEGLKTEIETLLTIGQGYGGNKKMLKKSGTLFLMLSGLGLGLAAFSLGKGLGLGVSAMSKILEVFTGENFADGIKKEVEILLSIGQGSEGNEEMLKEDGTFFKMMAGLGAGLIAFSVGKGVAGGINAITGIVDFFTGEPWAEKLKKEVGTLLSIGKEYNENPHDLDGFMNTMGDIGLGLIAFATAQGTVTGINAITGIVDYFTGEPWAFKLKTEVGTLLSIGKEADTSKSKNFLNAMTNISRGLLMFTAGQNFAALGRVGQSIVDFITGDKSPFEKLGELANEADDLTKAANAIEKIGIALSGFSNIKSMQDINFEKLARNLGDAIPLFKGLAGFNDGKVSRWGFDLDFGKDGILSKDLKLDEVAGQMEKINFILGKSNINPIKIKDAESTTNKIEETTKMIEAKRQEDRKFLEDLLMLKVVPGINAGTDEGAAAIVTGQGMAGAMAANNTGGGGNSTVNINGGPNPIDALRSSYINWGDK